MNGDPEVFGPDLTAPALAPFGASDAELNTDLDLDAQHPGEDFFYLFRSPRRFFSFFAQPERVSAWVLAKAVVGLCFVVWLHSFASSARTALQLQSLSQAFIHESGVLRLMQLFGRELNPAVLARVTQLLVFGLTQISVTLAPLAALLWVLLSAASASLLLRLPFRALFVIGCYATWFKVLGLFPFVPPWLLSLFVALSTAYGVKWAFGVRVGRALLALHGVLLLMAYFATMGGIALMTVFTYLRG